MSFGGGTKEKGLRRCQMRAREAPIGTANVAYPRRRTTVRDRICSNQYDAKGQKAEYAMMGQLISRRPRAALNRKNRYGTRKKCRQARRRGSALNVCRRRINHGVRASGRIPTARICPPINSGK